MLRLYGNFWAYNLVPTYSLFFSQNFLQLYGDQFITNTGQYAWKSWIKFTFVFFLSGYKYGWFENNECISKFSSLESNPIAILNIKTKNQIRMFVFWKNNFSLENCTWVVGHKPHSFGEYCLVFKVKYLLICEENYLHIYTYVFLIIFISCKKYLAYCKSLKL